MTATLPRLRAALAGIVRGPALALLAAEYRAAVIAERAAETAHTNTASGGTLRHAAMAAMLAARGVRTTAEARLGAALDGGR